MGCVDRRLRRKYHALLTLREAHLHDPWNVLAEVRETLHDDAGARLLLDPLSSLREHGKLTAFAHAPHAAHTLHLDGVEIERSTRLSLDGSQVELRYRLRGERPSVKLSIEPLLRCRPFHELTFENPFLDGSVERDGQGFAMQPYSGMPRVCFLIHEAAASFDPHGYWHNAVHYPWEAERGYPSQEDLFCPGSFSFELSSDRDVVLVVGVGEAKPPARDAHETAPGNFAAGLERAARQLTLYTKAGPDVLSGYPWLGSCSRDALIALPGFCLALDDVDFALTLLQGLLDRRVDGLIPDAPPTHNTRAQPSVEATLLFVRTVQWLAIHVGAECVSRLMPEVLSLVERLSEQRDGQVRLDDGVGVWVAPGPHPKTWMDAMVQGHPVTPRFGYTVELDALAYNAFHFAAAYAQKKRAKSAKALKARLLDAEARFMTRYWDNHRGYLADTHDGERADPCLRPNQLWALSLPFSPLKTEHKRSALAAIERDLLVDPGLRTLSPEHASYRRHYVGDQMSRDLAYHQGSVYPWLLGLYAEAVNAIEGPHALDQRLSPSLRFLAQHLVHEGCIGQVSELFDGEAPHTPRGTPAHARSVGEVYRVFRLLHGAETASSVRESAQ